MNILKVIFYTIGGILTAIVLAVIGLLAWSLSILGFFAAIGIAIVIGVVGIFSSTSKK